MINGPIWNKLPRFALPVAATAILEQLFNASDLAVVGNFTGAAKTASVAAVGANSPVIGLILNLFIGIALGTNVIIANAIGRDDRETVQRAVHTSVLTAIIGGFLVMIPCEIFAVQILSVMSIPEDVLPYAVLYLRIYLLGLPVILLYNFLSAVFRSVGDTKTPLIVLALSGCLNVLLNLFFVIVLKMTVNGVAIATVISNAISSIVLFIVLMKSDKYIKLSLRELRIDKRIGLPAGIQSAVFAISNIIIQAAINSLGTIVIAASSAAFNIEVIAYDVFNSFSQACTTFVGQNYGAGKLDRCKKTLLLSIAEDTIATAVTIGLVLFSGRFLLSIFTSDPQVIELGYTRLLLIFSAYTFSMLYEIMSGYLRGFGISLVPAILTTIGVCGTRVFWIYVVFPSSPTFKTIMYAYPISLSLTAVLIFIALLAYHPSRRFKGAVSAE